MYVYVYILKDHNGMFRISGSEDLPVEASYLNLALATLVVGRLTFLGCNKW